MPTIPSLLGSYIDETYQRLVQVSGSSFADGLGNAITLGPPGAVNPTPNYLPFNNAGAFQDSYLNQSGDILKTTSASVDRGLYFNFTNNVYSLGDLVGNGDGLVFQNGIYSFGTGSLLTDGFGLGIDWNQKFVKLGDYGGISNGTLLNIDDANQQIILNKNILIPDITTSPQSNVVTIDTSTGQLYYTASSAFGGGGGPIDTSGFVTTSSFNDYTSSVSSRFYGTASYALTASLAPDYVLNSATSSFVQNNQTSSFVQNNQTSSFVTNTQTSSFVQNNQTSSFVQNNQTSSFVTNTQTSSFVQNNQTSSFLTTGSFDTSQTISGSLIIDQNLTVLGTQSVQYITSSQLNISTNLITVNTATPAVRFGGLAVYDSGSTGTGKTGSILWDSQENVWIYTNPSGAAYDGAMFLAGPRSTTMGSEVGINSWYAAIGNGSHHMTSSQIYNSGSLIRLETNTEVTGSLNISAGITGSLEGTASWATNFVSASNYVLNSQTSSFVLNNQTSSMTVATASYITASAVDGTVAIVAGTNISITSTGPSGTGDVTINSTGGGGGGLSQGKVVAISLGYSNLF